jgi:type VII secretion integral membrane protein EccD
MTALMRTAETDATPELHTDLELCRLTVVAPRTRMDLALPVDATLADVLPTLLRHAGEDPNDPAFLRGGWSLQRIGEPPLDTARRLSAAGVRDGDILYLRHRDSAIPELAFDDVADAMTAATRRDGHRAWTVSTTRVASVLLGAVFAAGAAAALVSTGPSWVLPSAVLLTAAVLGVGLAAACARSFGSPEAGMVVAGVAVAFGFVGGVVLTAGAGSWRSGGASALLVGSAIALVLAGLAVLAVGKGQDGFVGVVAAATVGVVAGGVRTLGVGDTAGVAAITAVVLLAGTPLLPALAARIARLPMPVLPLSADDIRHATDVMPGRDVLDRARAADRVFTSLTAAGSVALALCAGWIIPDHSRYAMTLAAVIGAALWLRARHFTARAQRGWLLCAGAISLGLATYALGASGSTSARVLIPVVLLLGAVIALVWGVRMAGRRLTPYWGRLGDVLEVVVLLSVVPLALGVAGAYTAMQNLFG